MKSDSALADSNVNFQLTHVKCFIGNLSKVACSTCISAMSPVIR